MNWVFAPCLTSAASFVRILYHGLDRLAYFPKPAWPAWDCRDSVSFTMRILYHRPAGLARILQALFRLRFKDLGPLKGSLKIRCVDPELRELLPHCLDAVTLLESVKELLYCYVECCCSHALVSMVLRCRAKQSLRG